MILCHIQKPQAFVVAHVYENELEVQIYLHIHSR